MEKESKYYFLNKCLIPIALTQVKAEKIFESLVNEIHQTIYSLYRVKDIIKKLYNNIMNSIKA